MTIEATLSLSKENINLQLADNLGQLTIHYTKDKTVFESTASVYLLFKENTLKEIGVANEKLTTRTSFDTFVQLTPPWDTELDYLAQRLVETAEEANIKLIKKPKSLAIPANYYNSVSAYQDTVLIILEKFGFVLKAPETPKKPRPAKAQHRWRKDVSNIEFYVDDFDCKATIIWQKRNEMLIKKGAKLRKDYELNKDGSIGLDVRMTTQLRKEQEDKIENFVTTEDVILKSVNESGLFLYYGGRNGWLVFKDQEGKTIDEWTIVK